METHRSFANAGGAGRGEDEQQPRKTKRVGFVVGASGATHNDAENTNPNLQRRGTPHPRKKLKGSPQDEGVDKEATSAVPPPVFGRAESAVDYDPEQLDTANDSGIEKVNKPEEAAVETSASGNGEARECVNLGEEQEEGEEEEEEDGQEPSEEDKHWEALREEKQEQDDEVFECFVQGQERWKNANERLGHSLENCYTRMEEASVYAVQELITPIFNVEREKLRSLETECRKQLFDNHQRRNKFYKGLDKAEKRISADIRNLKAMALDVVPEPDESNGGDSPNNSQGSPEDHEDETSEGEHEEKDEALWQELLSDPNQPRSDVAQRFLTATQRLAEAEDRFLQAMNRTQEQWKGNAQFICDLVSDIHSEQLQKYEELDSYLRFKLVETDGREKELARKLEEEERKRQAYFSSLLGKVTAKASRFMGFGRSSQNKK